MSKNFIVKGKAKMGLYWVNFKKQVAAPTIERAIDKVLCTLGGNHKLKRFQIKIEGVEEQAGA